MRLMRVTAVVAMILFTSAVAAQDVKMTESSPYFPLTLNSTWTYTVGLNKHTFKVAKIEKVGTTVAAKLELSVDGKLVAHEHICVDKDYVSRCALEGKAIEPPVKFLPTQPKAGTSWNVDTKVSGQPLKGVFSVKDEKVKVNNTDYAVVTVSGQKLQANGVEVSLTYYFAKDVGMVRQVLETAGQKVVFDLVEYKIEK